MSTDVKGLCHNNTVLSQCDACFLLLHQIGVHPTRHWGASPQHWECLPSTSNSRLVMGFAVILISHGRTELFPE